MDVSSVRTLYLLGFLIYSSAGQFFDRNLNSLGVLHPQNSLNGLLYPHRTPYQQFLTNAVGSNSRNNLPGVAPKLSGTPKPFDNDEDGENVEQMRYQLKKMLKLLRKHDENSMDYILGDINGYNRIGYQIDVMH